MQLVPKILLHYVSTTFMNMEKFNNFFQYNKKMPLFYKFMYPESGALILSQSIKKLFVSIHKNKNTEEIKPTFFLSIDLRFTEEVSLVPLLRFCR